MTNKELLEKAAKAAGTRYTFGVPKVLRMLHAWTLLRLPDETH